MSPSLRQVWQQLARGSCLFFPFTSASVHDDHKDAQQSSDHNRLRAASSRTGSNEPSSDPNWSLRSPPPPLPRVELDTNAAIAFAFLLGSATALGASTVYRRFFMRIKSAEWITPDLLRRKRWITGVVTRCVLVNIPLSQVNTPTPWHWPRARMRFFIHFVHLFGAHSVGDADNFRLYHTPGFGWRGPFKFRHVPPVTKRGARPLYLPAPTNMILNQ